MKNSEITDEEGLKFGTVIDLTKELDDIRKMQRKDL
jgi:hypothetical protein